MTTESLRGLSGRGRIPFLPLSWTPRDMLSPLLFLRREMRRAWEISLTMDDRCSLFPGGEVLESPPSLHAAMDLLWGMEG